MTNIGGYLFLRNPVRSKFKNTQDQKNKEEGKKASNIEESAMSGAKRREEKNSNTVNRTQILILYLFLYIISSPRH